MLARSRAMRPRIGDHKVDAVAEPDGALRIRWRSVAIGSILLNFAAVAAVTSIITTQDADALSTVALVLAVIAFVCQLIVFSVQTWQSGDQLRQAERLHAQTAEMLAEVRTRTESTNSMVSRQYDELLHLASMKATSALAKEVETTDRVLRDGVPSAERIGALVRPIDGHPPGQDVALEGPRTSFPSTAPAAGQRGAVQLSPARLRGWTQWPSDPATAELHLNLLRELDGKALRALVFDIADEVESVLLGGEPGTIYTPGDQPLMELGLVTLASGSEDAGSAGGGEQRRVVLTEKGRMVGRLLTSAFPPPRSLAGLEEPLRELKQSLPSEVQTRLKDAMAEIDSPSGT